MMNEETFCSGTPEFIDCHCHLNSPELREGIPAALERGRAAGVTRMAVVGSTLADSLEAVEICRRYPSAGLFAVTGVHPHEVSEMNGVISPQLLEAAELPEVKAWGEIGLDYYYDLSPRPLQIRMLALQLEAAKAMDVPVVFHVRDAYDDFWPLMTSDRAPEKAELHCFTGSMEDARKALNRGWKLGVTGMITFKRADEIRDVIARLPVDALLCETDAPWMSPVPFRGKINEPSRVPLIYKKLAEIKGLPLDELTCRVNRSAVEFFGLEE
ncbi:MAG: TatD family hydrolase [Pyramidobacter sp.]|jgi:TatD DNase family protein